MLCTMSDAKHELHTDAHSCMQMLYHSYYCLSAILLILGCVLRVMKLLCRLSSRAHALKDPVAACACYLQAHAEV